MQVQFRSVSDQTRIRIQAPARWENSGSYQNDSSDPDPQHCTLYIKHINKISWWFWHTIVIANSVCPEQKNRVYNYIDGDLSSGLLLCSIIWYNTRYKYK